MGLYVCSVTGKFTIGLKAGCCVFLSPDVCFSCPKETLIPIKNDRCRTLYTRKCLASKSEGLFLFQGRRPSVYMARYRIPSRPHAREHCPHGSSPLTRQGVESPGGDVLAPARIQFAAPNLYPQLLDKGK